MFLRRLGKVVFKILQNFTGLYSFSVGMDIESWSKGTTPFFDRNMVLIEER